MPQSQNINIQEENDLKKLIELFVRNKKLFIFSVFIAISLAFLINRFSIPVYQISSSILIKENETQRSRSDVNDYLNSNLFGNNQNFQNELWVIKSSPVIEQTIRNLDLEVTYYRKDGFQYHDAYQNVPFQVSYLPDHPQPLNIRFNISILNNGTFQLNAESKEASFYNFASDKITHKKEKWFSQKLESLES